MMAGDARRRHQERYEAMGAQPVRKPRTTVTDPSPCKMEGVYRTYLNKMCKALQLGGKR